MSRRSWRKSIHTARLDNVLQTIGHTPLIRLNRITRDCTSTIYVKAECFNPGGSVKDRIGLALVEAAEKQGLLKPGGTIIEATAGNTGVGLALAAVIKKYRCIFVMPDKMSRDKIDLLRAYGAEVIVTPTSVPPDSPESYNGVADRLAREIPGAFRPNQFANPNNPLAHYLSTGPEIWEDTAGEIEVLVASMGTGGTISGTGKCLKERNPQITVVGADPEGSILSGDTPHPYADLRASGDYHRLEPATGAGRILAVRGCCGGIHVLCEQKGPGGREVVGTRHRRVRPVRFLHGSL